MAFGYNYDYNNSRQVTKVTDGVGNSKLLSYNGSNDVSQVRQVSSGETLGNVSYTYDANRNVTSATDNISGITTTYTYPSSNKGLPVSATVTGADNLTATTVYTYTSDYNYLTSVTDSSGATVSYTYDTSTGNVTKVTDANGNETNYTYNSSDLLSSVYASVGDETAQVNYQYDGINRLTNISNSDISYGFTYDLYGRRDTITNSGSTLSDLTYNTDGTVSRVDLADGTYATYTYDDRDRVTSASYDGTIAYTYKYNDNNALTEVYDADNDNTTSYLYDPAGRTVGISRTDGKNSAFAYDEQSRPVKTVFTQDNVVLNEQSYTYDSQSRISSVECETAESEISYNYDSLSRLTAKAETTRENKTVSKNYAYKTNGSNQTALVDSISYTKTESGVTAQVYPTLSYDYDNNGNITKVYENGVEKERYTYDSLNRLTREENVKLNRTYVMEYDANGDILSKKTYNLTTGALLRDMQYEYNNTTWKNAFEINGTIIDNVLIDRVKIYHDKPP